METPNWGTEPEALTLQDAATVLGVSTRTIRNWIQQKKIQAFKLGGRWRIRREEVSRLLNRPEQPSPPDAPYGEYE
jgi:excisionase family DNA binding protein